MALMMVVMALVEQLEARRPGVRRPEALAEPKVKIGAEMAAQEQTERTLERAVREPAEQAVGLPRLAKLLAGGP